MIAKKEYDSFIALLEANLIPALGCTEPISVALAAATARKVLGVCPQTMEVYCSRNILKNVQGVVVPNSDGKRGIEMASALGAIGGNPDVGLEVLANITPAHRALAEQMVNQHQVKCFLRECTDRLYISVVAHANGDVVEVDVVNKHARVERISKNGKVLLRLPAVQEKPSADIAPGSDLSVEKILAFAQSVAIQNVAPILDPQIEHNTRISAEGLSGQYGSQIGKTLFNHGDADIRTRAIAKAAAASDARMGGCSMPVVINSGSGNQGITVSIPVIEYAEYLQAGKEKLYRALVISNLVSIHIKRQIGDLSAFCGAVSAACGAGAAVTYLYGGTLTQITNTITNTVASVSGIICDGAKPSCAAKIVAALEAALLAHTMSMQGEVFHAGEGIIRSDIEDTIQCVGYVGRVGMQGTDDVISGIMLGDPSYRALASRH